MKAIIIGASGAVGRDRIDEQSGYQAFDEVKVLARKDIGMAHPQQITHIIDFDKPAE